MATGAARKSSSVSSADKRKDRRERRRVMVRYGTRATDKAAFTQNVSESGLFLQTHSVMAPGSTIQVKVQFPDREFHMWARVRWAKRAPGQLMGIVAAGMGIKFIDPSAEWLEYFHAHINSK
jgi:uncharacterized protein (TIGR02266 family)